MQVANIIEGQGAGLTRGASAIRRVVTGRATSRNAERDTSREQLRLIDSDHAGKRGARREGRGVGDQRVLGERVVAIGVLRTTSASRKLAEAEATVFSQAIIARVTTTAEAVLKAGGQVTAMRGDVELNATVRITAVIRGGVAIVAKLKDALFAVAL